MCNRGGEGHAKDQKVGRRHLVPDIDLPFSWVQPVTSNSAHSEIRVIPVRLAAFSTFESEVPASHSKFELVSTLHTGVGLLKIRSKDCSRSDPNHWQQVCNTHVRLHLGHVSKVSRLLELVIVKIL